MSDGNELPLNCDAVEACVDKEMKAKLLTLMSMAEKEQSLPLSKLSSTLNIPEGEELEEFLIEAVQMKAVNGKIDDEKGIFVVTSFHYRNFDRPQWELLQKRLNTLLRNMKRSQYNLTKLVNGEPIEM